MLAKFGMTGCKPIGTPLDVNLKLRPDEEEILKDSTMYRGSLNYLTVTRPDIAYAVSAVSQFMQEPRKPHFYAARQILRYVKGYGYRNCGLGILGRKDVDFRLNGYTADRSKAASASGDASPIAQSLEKSLIGS